MSWRVPAVSHCDAIEQESPPPVGDTSISEVSRYDVQRHLFLLSEDLDLQREPNLQCNVQEHVIAIVW